MSVRKPGQLWQFQKSDDQEPTTYLLLERFEKSDNHQIYWRVLYKGEVHDWREAVMESDTLAEKADD